MTIPGGTQSGGGRRILLPPVPAPGCDPRRTSLVFNSLFALPERIPDLGFYYIYRQIKMASYVFFKVTDVGLTVFSTLSSSVKLSGLATAAAGGVLERLRRFLRALGAEMQGFIGENTISPKSGSATGGNKWGQHAPDFCTPLEARRAPGC